MKRVCSILLCVFMIVSFSACSNQHIDFKDFSEYKSELEEVCGFLRSYYAKNGNSDKITFYISDGKMLKNDFTEVGEELCHQIGTIDSKGFDFVWVEEESIIFWEDETKYYGVLFAEKPRVVISSMRREWYPNMQAKRLNKNWYEIGVLDAI